MQIRLIAPKIQHGIDNQLPRQMVSHLTTPINAMQRSRRIVGIKKQIGLACTATEGVASLMLQQPNRLRSKGFGKQLLLPLLLPMLLPLRLGMEYFALVQVLCFCSLP